MTNNTTVNEIRTSEAQVRAAQARAAQMRAAQANATQARPAQARPAQARPAQASAIQTIPAERRNTPNTPKAKQKETAGGFKRFTEKVSAAAAVTMKKVNAAIAWYPVVRLVLLWCTLLASIGVALLFASEEQNSKFLEVLGTIFYFTGMGAAILSGPWKYIKFALGVILAGLKVCLFCACVPVLGWVVGLVMFCIVLSIGGAVLLVAPAIPALYCFFNEMFCA